MNRGTKFFARVFFSFFGLGISLVQAEERTIDLDDTVLELATMQEEPGVVDDVVAADVDVDPETRAAVVSSVPYSTTPGVTGSLVYTAAAFDPLSNSMFIGTTGGSQLGTVMQCVQQSSSSPFPVYFGKTTVELNGVSGQANPLYSQAVTHLEMTGKFFPAPVVTLGTGPTSLFVLDNQGSTISMNASPIVDAGGVSGTGVPAAIAANRQDTNSQIFFAAVPDNGTGTWSNATGPSGSNRAIAVLTRTKNALTQVYASGGIVPLSLILTSTTAAAPLASQTPVAFYDTGDGTFSNWIQSAMIGSGLAMQWDEKLQRLYVGLADVECGVNNATGGISSATGLTGQNGGVGSVVVGTLGTGNALLSLQPLISEPNPSGIKALGTGGIVSFYTTGRAGVAPSARQQVTVKNLGIMHTTTGYDYLIINGGVRSNALAAGATDILNSQVYALPLYGVTGSTRGQLAKKDFSDVASVANDFYNVNTLHVAQEYATGGTPYNGTGEVPALVGAEPRYLQRPSAYASTGSATGTCMPIHDMEIVGDSVYVATDAGVCYSTPIFNASGIISAWKPWQRVGGGVSTADPGSFVSVSTLGVNSSNGSVIYTTPSTIVPVTSTNVNTVASSLWGTSASVQIADGGVPGTSRGLTELIEQYFPASKGGVIAAYSIDPFTPGICASTLQYNSAKFSMLVLVGYDTVAFAQTMAGGLPTTTFVDGANFVVHTGGDLTAIAPLTSFDVLRSSASAEGFMYVSGLGGICRLENSGSYVWDSLNGLASVIAGSSFVDILGEIPGVRIFNKITGSPQQTLKVFGCGSHIKALTKTGYVRFTDKTGTTIASDHRVAANLVTDGVAFHKENRGLIYGTQNGINVINGQGSDTLTRTDGLMPLSLVYTCSTRGYNSPQGNLYVLFGDATQNKAQVVRYYVDMTQNASTASNVLKVISTDTVPLLDFTTYRDGMATDGYALFSTLSNSLNSQSDLVNMRSLYDAFATELSMDQLLSLDKTVLHAEANAPVITADGSRVLTGSFGALVNE